MQVANEGDKELQMYSATGGAPLNIHVFESWTSKEALKIVTAEDEDAEMHDEL